jgi:hypothetical protein
MAKRFTSPLYTATIANGDKVTIDVTNSISAGLEPNSGLIENLIPWMQERGCKKILDFGAGALRHTFPLLKAGFEVIAVEYESAYDRPKAKEYLTEARKDSGFTELIWPHSFLHSKIRYDVALLMYVLQVIPVKVEREIALKAIGEHFNRNGPKRLYYASRYGEAVNLSDDAKYNDGWVMGKSVHDRTFYTEWNAATTDQLFEHCGYKRAGSYKNASQPFIYDYHPGVL